MLEKMVCRVTQIQIVDSAVKVETVKSINVGQPNDTVKPIDACWIGVAQKSLFTSLSRTTTFMVKFPAPLIT